METFQRVLLRLLLFLVVFSFVPIALGGILLVTAVEVWTARRTTPIYRSLAKRHSMRLRRGRRLLRRVAAIPRFQPVADVRKAAV